MPNFKKAQMAKEATKRALTKNIDSFEPDSTTITSKLISISTSNSDSSRNSSPNLNSTMKQPNLDNSRLDPSNPTPNLDPNLNSHTSAQLAKQVTVNKLGKNLDNLLPKIQDKDESQDQPQPSKSAELDSTPRENGNITGPESRDPKNHVTQDDFNYLSQRLTKMPGSWIGQRGAAQFEDEDAQFNDPNGSRYHEIVDSLNNSPSVDLQREMTFESLEGELESTSDTVSGAADGAGSRHSSLGAPIRKSVVMSKVPDLPKEAESGETFKRALESMLSAGGGGGIAGAEGTAAAAAAAAVSTSSPRSSSSSSSSLSFSIPATATAAVSGSPTQLNFDSERRTSSSAFTIVDTPDVDADADVDADDDKRFTNPLFKHQSGASSIYSEAVNKSRVSVPLASIPEGNADGGKVVRSKEMPPIGDAAQSFNSGPASHPKTHVISVSSSIYSALPRGSRIANTGVAANSDMSESSGQLASVSAGFAASASATAAAAAAAASPGSVQRIMASFSSAPNASSIASKSAIDSLLSADAGSVLMSDTDTTDTLTPDMFDPDDASALFVAATYPFNASTLDSDNDAAICLSFGQNDIAFTYNLDESGWGEVILVDSLQRGWVPMNYFKSAVEDSLAESEGRTHNEKLASSRLPLRVLFRNAGKFLLNPQSKPFYLSGHLRGYVFDVECFNGITDGVRKLLIDTDCISRSNTIVQRKPIVRRRRKKLLRSWSDLMAKAKKYMHTMDPSKIEYLQLLTFDVLKRAAAFLEVWGAETADLDLDNTEEQRHRQELSTFTFDLIYLERPPLVGYRANEIYDQLVSGLSMISGRIDLVEHNVQGCRVLETVVGQINLMVNEEVFVMKWIKAKLTDAADADANGATADGASADGATADADTTDITAAFTSALTSSETPIGASLQGRFAGVVARLRALDSNASKLEQVVDELNSFVRVMIDVATRRKIQNNLPERANSNISRGGSITQASARASARASAKGASAIALSKGLYFYSREGGAIVINACKMIGIASTSHRILKSLLSTMATAELHLPAFRKYPNYVKMGISPADFVQRCSVGLMGDKGVRRQVSEYRKRSTATPRVSKRFSVFRAGNSGDMQISDDGLDFLAGISSKENTPFINEGGEFEELVGVGGKSGAGGESGVEVGVVDSADADSDLSYNSEADILRAEDGKLLGASFRALVALLTDESHPPSYFFTSTFFLTFRIFANGSMLLEELIRRFDVRDMWQSAAKENSASAGFSSQASRIKARRRLVCKAFQLWLESYWKPRSDYALLAPLINFFNEGVKPKMPVEGYQLLVVASRLVGQPPVETMRDKLNYSNNIDSDSQLLPRKISPKLHKKQILRISQLHDLNGGALMSELDAYNSFMDDIDSYGLKEVKEAEAEEGESGVTVPAGGATADGATADGATAAAAAPKSGGVSFRKSLNLGMHLELSDGTSSSVLLTSQQMELMKTVVISYRRMLGDHWTGDAEESGKSPDTFSFTPLDTSSLIESWWRTSQESWKCLNQSLILLNFNGLELAKQLTLIESKMFCCVKVSELLNQNFTTKKLHLNLSPNIQRSVLFTNLLSEYVIESVLQPDIEMKRRAHYFKCWLKVAISCLYLRNFNSLASIMTSLQSFLITRVQSIWEGLSDKYRDLFHYLASIIHPEKNYNVYRDKLRDFLQSNLEDDLEIPIVPYLSLFLQDLTFVVDGNGNFRNNSKSFLNEKLINIDKFFKITQIIADIQTLQVPYTDTGELGAIYNSVDTEQMRSQAIRNLEKEIPMDDDVNFADMFDISGVPCLQEMIFLEIWKVKQNNAREEDRAWKLSCTVQPRDQGSDKGSIGTVTDETLTSVANIAQERSSANVVS
ncbi:hypothetical protein FOA43_002977 [Brettanomyces nanus]|uniref:Uncharacterized protein n=1 Tax=Eeniella nana TaxID=13502 RepID=A0A875RPY3_EENNA|nr:uncharacterized protein FOA43_002977 [Brettanomyces nanus]QPG75620.1 hypothetical protein FOA43_002977 [Brettanomyces nanus]